MKPHSLELEVLVEQKAQNQFWLDVDIESKRPKHTRFGHMLEMQDEGPQPFVLKTGRKPDPTPGGYEKHCLLICDNGGKLDHFALGATLQAYLRIFHLHKGVPRFMFQWSTWRGGAVMLVTKTDIEYQTTGDIMDRWVREGR